VDLQAGEDPKYSVVAKVDLKKVFGRRTVSRNFAAALLVFFIRT
jgi:hypothetical protein